MKSINARTTLKRVLLFSWFIALAVVRSGYAGEYYIYHDPNGKLVISNYAPPQGSSVIKRETLPEVTEQQIRESQLRDNQIALDNRLASLEQSVAELTETLRAQSEVTNNLQEGQGNTNVAVGVTQPVPIVTQAPIIPKPPHRRFHRPENFRRNFPNAQPRHVAPAAPRFGGGRTG